MQADRQIRQISVLTSAQSLSSITNVLPSMQADRQFPVLTNAQSFLSFINILPSMQAVCQFPVLTNAQSFSSFTKVLPSTQVDNRLLYHRFMVVFRSGQNMAPHSCARSPLSTVLADVNRLLVNLLCVLAVSKHIYILDSICHRGMAVLFRIMIMTCRSLYSLLLILQILSRRFTTQIWHLLNSHTSIPVSSATTLSFMDVSSSGAYIGGGCSRIARDTIQPYIVSQPSTLYDRSILSYVAYVEKVKVETYPSDQFVHANIPLLIVSQLLSLTSARSIAASHGIATGSRCNVAQLRSLVEQHECVSCPLYLTIFSVENDSTTKHAMRSRRYRENMKAAKTTSTTSERFSIAEFTSNRDTTERLVHAEFPPLPSSIELEHTIIKDVCKRMDPVNFEEVGCAVCGELHHRAKTSRLKGVKKILGILEAPGVTRVERKCDATSIKEFKGPVLDYSCSTICDGCRSDVRRGKVPRLALARGLWLGKVPVVLDNLTFVEKLLVARVRHTCAFVKVSSGMRKMKANIVAFESPIQKIYKILPPPREDLDEMLAILFTGPCKPTAEDFARTPFLVRRNAVIKALEWLKLNHVDYADIEVSHANLMQYGETVPPVSVEYRWSESNKEIGRAHV